VEPREAFAAGLPEDEDEPEAGGAASPVRPLLPWAALRSPLLLAPDWPPTPPALVLLPDEADDPAGCCLIFN
jgi:hypothetical protein